MKIEPSQIAPLHTWQHGSQLTCCQFLPGDAALVAAGHDGHLYRLARAGEERPSIAAHQGWVEALRWTPDRSRLLSADSWGQVRAWQPINDWLATDPVWTIPCACNSWLRDLAISPDGQRLATVGQEPVVRVYRVSDGMLLQELRGPTEPVLSVAFDRQAELLACGDRAGLIHVWDLSRGVCQRSLNASALFQTYYQYRQGGVRSLALSPDGRTLYAAGFAGTNANQAQGNPLVLAFDWETGQLSATLTPAPALNGPVTDIVVHPSGLLIAAGSSEGGGLLWMWPPGATQPVHHVKHPTSFRRLALAADGRQLAAPAFGNLDGQRGGNGRRLDKEGRYPDFGGSLVVFQWT